MLADLPEAFMTAVAVLLGLVLGSFLNVVIYRWPRGESIVSPGSHCPACGKPIRIIDNLPVLGFVLLRGKAHCCRARISPRYPIVEACGGLLAWAILKTIVFELPADTPLWRAGLVFVVYLTLGLGLIAAAFIDLDHMYLPDEITLGGTLLGVLSVPVRTGATFKEAVLGAAIGFVMVWLPFDVIYARLRGVPGMGLGDAKLTLLAGAWFGWRGALFALLGGAVQATLAALIVYAVRGRIEEPASVLEERAAIERALAVAEGEERAALEHEIAQDPLGRAPEPGLGKARLAFGPFLVLAILEYMLFGSVLGEWLFLV